MPDSGGSSCYVRLVAVLDRRCGVKRGRGERQGRERQGDCKGGVCAHKKMSKARRRQSNSYDIGRTGQLEVMREVQLAEWVVSYVPSCKIER